MNVKERGTDDYCMAIANERCRTGATTSVHTVSMINDAHGRAQAVMANMCTDKDFSGNERKTYKMGHTHRHI
jgi:hypothetical protein